MTQRYYRGEGWNPDVYATGRVCPFVAVYVQLLAEKGSF